jgi:hypothetical protein
VDPESRKKHFMINEWERRIMVTVNVESAPMAEELLAELAAVAYGVALRHGIKGPFIDVELDLWRELRVVLDRHEEDGRWLR